MTSAALPPDSGQELGRFRSLVVADPALQRELLEEAASRRFLSLAAATAKRLGITLSEAELSAAMRATQLSWQLRWR